MWVIKHEYFCVSRRNYSAFPNFPVKLRIQQESVCIDYLQVLMRNRNIILDLIW